MYIKVEALCQKSFVDPNYHLEKFLAMGLEKNSEIIGQREVLN